MTAVVSENLLHIECFLNQTYNCMCKPSTDSQLFVLKQECPDVKCFHIVESLYASPCDHCMQCHITPAVQINVVHCCRVSKPHTLVCQLYATSQKHHAWHTTQASPSLQRHELYTVIAACPFTSPLPCGSTKSSLQSLLACTVLLHATSLYACLASKTKSMVAQS